MGNKFSAYMATAFNGPLHDAASSGDVIKLRRLLSSKVKVDVQNESGMTGLHCAAMFGQTEAVTLLLHSGAKAKVADKLGYTPLMFAAAEGHEKSVKLLVSAKTPLNARCDAGWTAAMFAAAGGHSGCLWILLTAGCDVTVRTNTGKSAIDLAANEGHNDVVAMLRMRPNTGPPRSYTGTAAPLRHQPSPGGDIYTLPTSASAPPTGRRPASAADAPPIPSRPAPPTPTAPPLEDAVTPDSLLYPMLTSSGETAESDDVEYMQLWQAVSLSQENTTDSQSQPSLSIARTKDDEYMELAMALSLSEANNEPKPNKSGLQRKKTLTKIHMKTEGNEKQLALKWKEYYKRRNQSVMKKLEAHKDKMMCKICLDEEVEVIFTPCRHMVSCSGCSRQLQTCPICRAKVVKAEKVFLS